MIWAITTGILAEILLAVILWYVVVGKGHSAIEGDYEKRIETYNKEIGIKLNEKQAIERDIQSKQAAEEAVNATREKITSTAVELQKQVDAVEATKKENEVAANSCNASISASNAKLAEIERAIKDGKAEFDKWVENIKNIKEQQASETSKLNQIKDNFRVATLRTDKSFTAPGSKINISEKDRMDVNELEHYCEVMRCKNAVKKALYTACVQDEVDRIIKDAKAAGVCGI